MFPFTAEIETECSLWNCVILKEDCSLFRVDDHMVFYLTCAALGFYALFLILLLADLKYWWALDRAQQQIYYYVETAKKKLIRHVQTQQRHLPVQHNKKNRSSLTLKTTSGDPIELETTCVSRFSVATVMDRSKSRELWSPIDEDPKIWDENPIGDTGNASGDEFCVI